MVRPPSWASKISFTSELDALATCRSVCVHRLVADLEAGVEPQLTAMARLPWNSFVQVGDQSGYVTAIVNHLRTQIPLIRETLPAFTQICIKFADTLITRFVNSLYRCKPVNTFGAEQLLLDTQSLKASLLQVPLFGAKVSLLLLFGFLTFKCTLKLTLLMNIQKTRKKRQRNTIWKVEVEQHERSVQMLF
ncbi:unnamed protein product [Trichobilharzia regenti]|nr:unnamed protein product [Trichobilharzia regenti]